jgi:hypothetical protein
MWWLRFVVENLNDINNNNVLNNLFSSENEFIETIEKLLKNEVLKRLKNSPSNSDLNSSADYLSSLVSSQISIIIQFFYFIFFYFLKFQNC